MNDLIERLRSEAEISDRTGQFDRLNAIADEFAAEIKALRAEVEGWKGQHMRDSAELRRLCQHRDEYKARAERLAEALRGWWKAHRPVGWTDDQHRSCPHVNLATDAEKALATALLRDQEEGHENTARAALHETHAVVPREPVAWRRRSISGRNRWVFAYAREAAHFNQGEWEPLYAAPPPLSPPGE